MFDSNHFHPMVVHFPIALLVVGFLADLASVFFKNNCYPKAGFMLQLLGTLGLIASYATGDWFTGWESFSGATKDAFLLHQNSAFVALWISIISLLFRVFVLMMKRSNTWLKWIVLLLVLLTAVAIGRVGFYGGDLVLNYLMGI